MTDVHIKYRHCSVVSSKNLLFIFLWDGEKAVKNTLT